MLRSLRARLLLLTLFVAGIAILTVSLLSRQAVRTEFIRFESRSREAGLADAADALGTRLTSDGDVPTPAAMAGADSILRGVARVVGQPLLLLDAEGHVLAASSAALRAARINREAGDRLAIVEEAREGTTRSLKRTVVVGGPRVLVRTPGGAPLGTLYLLPNAAAERVERPFVATVNRWLLLAVLGAGAVAFLLALARLLSSMSRMTILVSTVCGMVSRSRVS